MKITSRTSFWEWLESRPGRTAVRKEWRSVANTWAPAIGPMLAPLDRRATVYPNPRPHGLPMKIVVHRDGQVVAIDERDWQHRVALRPEDIILHQLDLRRLRTALCNTLDGLNVAKTPVDQDTGRLQIGNWEPKKAARFPVHLLLCQHRGLLRRQISQLTATDKPTGAILLIPTRMNWDDELISLTRQNSMLLVPLCEIIAPMATVLHETPAWDEYLQAFCQMVKLTLPANYRNTSAAPMRGKRTANIELLEKELEEHLAAARDYAFTLQQRGREPALLPRPEQKDLAKRVGITQSAVSRCLNDPRARMLKILWRTADSLEDVMRYGRR